MTNINNQQSTGARLESILKSIREKRTMPISTSFKELDNILNGGFPIGLTVLGAPPGTGKTTLQLQIADAMAKAGNIVHYFAYEMTATELVLKSLSRLTSCNSDYPSLSITEVMKAIQEGEAVYQIIEEYKLFAENLYIHEADEKVGFKEIENIVIDSKESFVDKQVILFVDYLQIMPIPGSKNEKQHLDQLIPQFSRLARRNNICVVVISSLNRSNYNSEADFSAFKESGAIEFGADVILSLQMKAIADLKNMKNEDSKRRFLLDMRAQEIKEMELVLLKQRLGIGTGRVNYLFQAKYNKFEEQSNKLMKGVK